MNWKVQGALQLNFLGMSLIPVKACPISEGLTRGFSPTFPHHALPCRLGQVWLNPTLLLDAENCEDFASEVHLLRR